MCPALSTSTMCYFYNQLQQVMLIALPGLQGPEPALEALPLYSSGPHRRWSVNFKDFLTVMTDTRRYFCSVGEQGEPRALQSWGGGQVASREELGHPGVSHGNGSHHPMSPEQNALMDMAPPSPHTLFFEILSLLVEMLALPKEL